MAAVVLAVAVGAAACGDPPEPQRKGPPAVVWRAGPSLPAPTTNNAVAAVETSGGVEVYSFLGLGPGKTHADVTNRAFRWRVGEDAWEEIDPVPGPGRLASTAQVVKGRIYLLGGYTVAADGTERSVPDVNVYDPETRAWTRGADMPVPVDDAVAGVWRDSLIVVVSGWHDDGNVANVQLYDPAADHWYSAGRIPGTPVFGHTGAVVGDAVTYIDGVRTVDGAPRYTMEAASWAGALDPVDPTRIEWTRLPPHPGPALYRAAGGVVGLLAVFVGGTDNPYNYDGVGYDGRPSDPIRQVLAYAAATGEWHRLAAPPVATMDHRNLGSAGGQVFLVGGMEAGQQVTDDVWYADVEALLATLF